MMATSHNIFLCLALCAMTASAYWLPFHGATTPSHITAIKINDLFSTSGPVTGTEQWTIEAGDKFIPMEFIGYTNTAAFTLFIKPGQKWMLAWIDTAGQWRYHLKGGNKIGNWPTSSSDQYVSGRFRGSVEKDLLISNPDGRYTTYKLNVDMDITNYPTIDYEFSFEQLQYATNGNVQAGDKLISGFFDNTHPHNQEIHYTVLIKPTGYYVMKFNTVTNNWDILSSSSNGQIYWWAINANDKYVVGSFQNNPVDQLLCLNPNGWHHLMNYDPTTHTFVYATGGSAGYIGTWQIGPHNKFIAGRFDLTLPITLDNQQLLAIDPNGQSKVLKVVNNQWVEVDSNNGDGKIAGWWIGWHDHYTKVESFNNNRYRVLAFNNQGWWKSMQWK